MEFNVKKLSEAILKTKAENVVLIDINKISSIADYYILATGTSSTSIKAIADFCEVELEKEGVKVLHREGYTNCSWIILDYGDVIVHIFDQSSRDFFNLEKLWASGDNVTKLN